MNSTVPARTIIIDEASFADNLEQMVESPLPITFICENPGDIAAVPPDDYFPASGFYDDVRLERMGEAILAHYNEFGFLKNADATVHFLWKQKGGKSAGQHIYGKCQKPSGLLKVYSGADFIVWIAADHVRDSAFTNGQLEALLYHECCHIGYDTDEETGDMVLALKAHDHELFWEELRRYGAWNSKRKRTGEVYKQIVF